jgi:hypothetical protein
LFTTAFTLTCSALSTSVSTLEAGTLADSEVAVSAIERQRALVTLMILDIEGEIPQKGVAGLAVMHFGGLSATKSGRQGGDLGRWYAVLRREIAAKTATHPDCRGRALRS